MLRCKVSDDETQRSLAERTRAPRAPQHPPDSRARSRPLARVSASVCMRCAGWGGGGGGGSVGGLVGREDVFRNRQRLSRLSTIIGLTRLFCENCQNPLSQTSAISLKVL